MTVAIASLNDAVRPMRAYRYEKTGDLDNLRYTTVSQPTLGPGLALIKVQATGVNLSDVVGICGWLPFVTTPRVPGRDFAGVVTRVNDEEHQGWVGTEVWGTGGNVGFCQDGAWAEDIAAPVSALCKRPSTLSATQAASVGLPWLCADLAVHRLARITSDDSVLIVGARGAIGSAAVQLCRKHGARSVFGTMSSTPVKAPTDYTPVDLSQTGRSTEQYAELLKGLVGKVNVVIDAFGADYNANLLNATLDVLQPGGRIVVMAAHDKTGMAKLNLRKLYAKGLTLHGLSSGQVTQEGGARLLERLSSGFEDGSLKCSQALHLVDFHDPQAVRNAIGGVYDRQTKGKMRWEGIVGGRL
ncbi:hypothetical protein HDU87_006659 [Geranomyces variabilis]|uniref:Enoyl reductase (ER) domain-containing protein n=1 Tax=Geranomyces variabilis TaxID=109894 RepID=A0AAD5TKF1_9FUNG|nr:hypothetical protein HDU87_006659 [Geranomyces variabilis]